MKLRLGLSDPIDSEGFREVGMQQLTCLFYLLSCDPNALITTLFFTMQQEQAGAALETLIGFQEASFALVFDRPPCVDDLNTKLVEALKLNALAMHKLEAKPSLQIAARQCEGSSGKGGGSRRSWDESEGVREQRASTIECRKEKLAQSQEDLGERGSSVTLTTVASLDRCWTSLYSAAHWDGPVSIAYFARSRAEQRAIRSFVSETLAPFCRRRGQVFLSLVLRKGSVRPASLSLGG